MFRRYINIQYVKYGGKAKNNQIKPNLIKLPYNNLNFVDKEIIKFKKSELAIIKDNKKEIKKVDIQPVENYPDI